MFIHREQIGIGYRARPVHFKFQKIFSVNVLRSVEAVQNRQTDLAVGIRFHVRNIQPLSDFLGHVVTPGCAWCGGNYWSSENGTKAETTNSDKNISHDVNSHA